MPIACLQTERTALFKTESISKKPIIKIHKFKIHKIISRKILLALGLYITTCSPVVAGSFITFESGQVRPLALSSDGSKLFVTNTPDNRLEIFNVANEGLSLAASVPVGLEPVAVAVRNDGEVWVVNHLSDSVSIVDVSTAIPQVKRTLLVGDEPRDIVFSANDRAFITTARRGQQRTDPSIAGVPGAGDPLLTTPSTPRADVWVFDGANPGAGVGGTPLKIVELFGDTPRALAVSPDGNTVFAAILFSGNQTASVSEGTVCDHEEAPCDVKGQLVPGDIAGPKTNANGDRAPRTGIIVKQDPQTNQFIDPEGRDWTDVVKFTLPDRDVFAIDATSLNEVESFQHVGTTLFNMVANPQSGALYVSNFEANNFELFVGAGNFGGSTVQGHLSEARITVIKDGQVLPRHLNKHINYDITPAPPGTKEHSLAMPLEMVVSNDGALLAVAAYGSSKIGIFDTAEIENDSFDPEQTSANYIDVSGGGPSGLALDETRNRLYVLTRFDNSISIVDMESRQEIEHIAMFNPEPRSVIEGRPFLYDAQLTSSNGEAACASCHIFGDVDHLAWNLGNPDGDVKKNPLDILLQGGSFIVDNLNGTGEVDEFHPMKGPMTTQTLRGLVNAGAMHWRGDRASGFFGDDLSDGAPFDSELNFNNFIVAFTGLVGREEIIAESDMQKFTDFALQVTLPPNPVRALDNSLSRAEARGKEYFMGCDGGICNGDGVPIFGGHRSDGVPVVPGLGFTCEGCHTLDPAQGFFGTDGNPSFDALNQTMKVTHIRNTYTKVGMFGNPPAGEVNAFDNEFTGEQIRGFGMFHDGGVDTIERFMNGQVFNEAFFGAVGFFGGDPQRQDIEAFMLAFDSDLAPITGQQVTLEGAGSADVNNRIDMLIERAEADYPSQILGAGAKECELVVKGVVEGAARGWLFDADAGNFRSDRAGESPFSDSELRAIAAVPGQALTYTCVPFGSGERIALDRELDGVLDGDQNPAQNIPDPIVEDPAVVDPVNEDPVVVDPVDEDPVVVDPVNEEPVDEDPVVVDPVDEEPVDEIPVLVPPGDEDPLDEIPVVVKPVVTPVDEDPVDEIPVLVAPGDENPGEEIPVVVNPVVTPVDEEPVAEDPVVVEPVVEEPVAEDPVSDEPNAEEDDNADDSVGGSIRKLLGRFRRFGL